MKQRAAPKAVHYFVAEKNPHHGEAILAGWKAEKESSKSRLRKGGWLHLLGGLQHGVLELMRELHAGHERYVFFDRAYFLGGPGTPWLRAVPNAYQHSWLVAGGKRGGARWKKLGIAIAPWRRKRGRKVMVVPPSEAIRALFNLGDWERRMVERLKEFTDREIDVSRKGDTRSLRERLEEAHCVVTYSSNVAVEAVLAGVPCFVSERNSAAIEVCDSLGMLGVHLDNPLMPEREEWAEALAWGQFTLDEIRDGTCRRVVTEEMEALR